MNTESKNIIGYIVESDPITDYRTMCLEGRYLFQTRNMAYRYILKLVDMVKARYRRILESGYEEIHYLDYTNCEIDEEKSVPLDDTYSYSIKTTIHTAFGFENVYVSLLRRTEADLSSIVPNLLDSPDSLGLLDSSMFESDQPQYLSEPIRTTTIKLIPVYSKSEEDIIIQDLEITATKEDAVNFVRKHAVCTIKLPGQPIMEFSYASDTEEEYNPK